MNKVTKRLNGRAVLTIGEQDKFLEKGGIVNFVREKKKIRFEINLNVAEQARLQIRAKLVRLAKRVIKKKKSKEGENDHER